jgi:Na+/proline symporter
VTGTDWAVVALYFLLMLAVGLYFTRRASRSVVDYFVSGRDLPWWVIALSAVATYTDAGLAPAVTMLTYQGGLLGNAVWWIPYVIWMPLGAVLWSKYWRRLGTVTSAELLSVRYSGRFAEVNRGVYAGFMSFGFIVVLKPAAGLLSAPEARASDRCGTPRASRRHRHFCGGQRDSGEAVACAREGSRPVGREEKW